MSTELDDKVLRFISNMEMVNDLVHGDETVVVQTDTGAVPSIRKAIADGLTPQIEAAIDAKNLALDYRNAAQGFRNESLASRDEAGQAASDSAQALIDINLVATEVDTASGAAIAARDKAMDWADKAPNSEVETGKYSARHWAGQAQAIVSGALIYRGTWDASTGVYPTPPNSARPDYYKVSGTGTVSGVDFAPGDHLIYDGSGGWDKIDNTEVEAPPVVGLTNVTEDVSVAAPNASVPVVSFTATNAAANVDFALRSKGAGALMAHVADDSIAGGAKRGINAVDWQMSRSVASQVAAGNFSSLGGGQDNAASGLYSAVFGGSTNYASAAYSFVGGGVSNTASGNSAAITGGIYNVSSASYSVISGGYGNTASAESASIGGGTSNLANAPYSTIPGGKMASTHGVYGKYAYASGQFSSVGDAQRASLTLRAATTGSTPSVLTSDGAAPATANQLILQNNQAMTVRGQVSCRRSSAQAPQAAGWEFTVVVTRAATASTVELIVPAAITSIANNIDGLAVFPFTVTADTANGCLAVTVIGPAATDLRWLCTVTSTEVIYA